MCAYDIYYVWWFCKQNWASFHVGCLCCCPTASSHAIPHSSHASQRLHRTKVVLKAYFNIQNSDNTNETLFENIFIVISSLQWHSSENCFFDNLIVLVSLLCSQLHHLQPSTTLTQTRSHESRKQKKMAGKNTKKNVPYSLSQCLPLVSTLWVCAVNVHYKIFQVLLMNFQSLFAEAIWKKHFYTRTFFFSVG